MTQRLQRSNPAPRIYLQNLLHKVYKLKYLSPFLDSVLYRHLIDILIDLSHYLHLLSLELQDMVVLQQLTKVEVRVISLWLLN